ncbi:MAG: hypothetical protein HYY64_01955 [Candidatus Rokubacteria bacterium]|nr:hypothetical protein [Candidatus Rokubacteria bacterium]
MTGAPLPFFLLLGFGIAFAAAALGGGLLVFDDHPGQLFRLWHGLTRGLLPWEWNPDWWGGYPELQFYPPGFVYLGALIHYGALAFLSPMAVYKVLLWIIYLLPGVTAFWLLARILPSPWLALPAAFVTLTLSAGTRSGVEEGLRWGLIAARLGWGLLPMLALSLVRWQERGGRLPLLAAPLLAGIVLTHPAHAPAGVGLVLLAAFFGEGSRRDRFRQAAWILVVSGGLTAFWTLPLFAHLNSALPLAWGEFSAAALGRDLLRRPLLVVLVAGWLAGWVAAARASALSRPAFGLLALLPLLSAITALDALVIEPLGFRWLPADRLLDSVKLALVLGGGAGIAWALWPALRRSAPKARSAGLVATAGLVALGIVGAGEPTLSLWPRQNDWPKLEETARGLRLPELWTQLRSAPPGRILFVRSAVPLRFGREWWRPHTHITALTPMFTGRAIINGTFTHPSPVAGLVYTGSADNRPITRLAEQLDGKTLFGRPLETLAPAVFDPLAEQLGISTVVALDEDRGRLPFVETNPRFSSPRQVGPFLVFALKDKLPTPEFQAALADWNGRWGSVGVVLTALALVLWGATALVMRGRP